MDLNGSVNEVTSILAIYNTTTSDADTRHCTYMLDIMLGGKCNSVTMSQCVPLTHPQWGSTTSTPTPTCAGCNRQVPPQPSISQPPTPQIPPLAAAATNADEMMQHLLCALINLGQSTPQNLPPQTLAPTPSTQTHTCAPDTFNGSNLEDLQAFLLQCQITFNAHPQNFTSESAKVCFTISYLKKTALEWFEQGILEDDPTQAPGWKSSWMEFVKELHTHFRPTNPTGVAEVEL